MVDDTCTVREATGIDTSKAALGRYPMVGFHVVHDVAEVKTLSTAATTRISRAATAGTGRCPPRRTTVPRGTLPPREPRLAEAVERTG
jgi:hypothetical protein